MSKSINATIKRFLKKHKNLNYLPGAVAILHTFGSGKKWHVHFHVLITAGGMRDGKWIDNDYLNEKALKKTWKAKLSAGLRKLYRQGKLINATGSYPGQTFLQMLSSIHDKKWHVWIDFARGDSNISFSYIGRYMKRACISQKGIILYRRGKLVVWKERSKRKVPNHCAHRASPHQFINLMIQHIPDRYERQIFYYGLYSPYHLSHSTYKKAKAILLRKLKKVCSVVFALKKIKLTLSKLMQWTHDIDPLVCPKCGAPMQLTGIIFFNPGIPKEKNILQNYRIKNYQLVKKEDSS